VAQSTEASESAGELQYIEVEQRIEVERSFDGEQL
jgi:hypothetical protein